MQTPTERRHYILVINKMENNNKCKEIHDEIKGDDIITLGRWEDKCQFSELRLKLSGKE